MSLFILSVTSRLKARALLWLLIIRRHTNTALILWINSKVLHKLRTPTHIHITSNLLDANRVKSWLWVVISVLQHGSKPRLQLVITHLKRTWFVINRFWRKWFGSLVDYIGLGLLLIATSEEVGERELLLWHFLRFLSLLGEGEGSIGILAGNDCSGSVAVCWIEASFCVYFCPDLWTQTTIVNRTSNRHISYPAPQSSSTLITLLTLSV